AGRERGAALNRAVPLVDRNDLAAARAAVPVGVVDEQLCEPYLLGALEVDELGDAARVDQEEAELHRARGNTGPERRVPHRGARTRAARRVGLRTRVVTIARGNDERHRQ